MGVLKYKSGNSWISVPTIRGERGIQGEQGIQGPPGSNGVYVGATAPTDPDINVWVDTDEPGQTVVTSVNGMSGSVVLFETGTDGTWSWKKWNDGVLELERRYSGPPTTGTHYTTVGGLYGYRVTDFTFPSSINPINSNYTITANWKIASGFAIDAGSVGTKSTTGFSLFGMGSSSGVTSVEIDIYIRARWK